MFGEYIETTDSTIEAGFEFPCHTTLASEIGFIKIELTTVIKTQPELWYTASSLIYANSFQMFLTSNEFISN